jgi:hypothetical protein
MGSPTEQYVVVVVGAACVCYRVICVCVCARVCTSCIVVTSVGLCFCVAARCERGCVWRLFARPMLVVCFVVFCHSQRRSATVCSDHFFKILLIGDSGVGKSCKWRRGEAGRGWDAASGEPTEPLSACALIVASRQPRCVVRRAPLDLRLLTLSSIISQVYCFVSQ